MRRKNWRKSDTGANGTSTADEDEFSEILDDEDGDGSLSPAVMEKAIMPFMLDVFGKVAEVCNKIFNLQEDMVCLSCTGTGERVCLSAEGFGNRHCFLEGIADRVRLLAFLK